jgi:hypothetical protein
MRFVNTSNNFSVSSYQGGPFLAQLFSLFTQIASNTLISTPVLSIHATHDTTIKPILNFFGQVLSRPLSSASAIHEHAHVASLDSSFSCQNSGNSSSEFGWPPYSAMLVFELRKDGSGNYFVRVVYNGRQISLPVLQAAKNGLYDLQGMTAYVAIFHRRVSVSQLCQLPRCQSAFLRKKTCCRAAFSSLGAAGECQCRIRVTNQQLLTICQVQQRGPAPAPLQKPSNDTPDSTSSALITWQIVSGVSLTLLLVCLLVIFRCESQFSCYVAVDSVIATA